MFIQIDIDICEHKQRLASTNFETRIISKLDRFFKICEISLSRLLCLQKPSGQRMGSNVWFTRATLLLGCNDIHPRDVSLHCTYIAPWLYCTYMFPYIVPTCFPTLHHDYIVPTCLPTLYLHVSLHCTMITFYLHVSLHCTMITLYLHVLPRYK